MTTRRRRRLLRGMGRRNGRSGVPPHPVQRWHAFESRLADGTILEAVIQLANGEEVSVSRDTPILLGPGDTIVWREDRGWGWTTGVPGSVD